MFSFTIIKADLRKHSCIPFPLLLVLAGGGEAESLLSTLGLPLPFFGSSLCELRAVLPFPLLAGGGGVQGGEGLGLVFVIVK